MTCNGRGGIDGFAAVIDPWVALFAPVVRNRKS
jgi:hypothetical protein